jgi:hypothetical protein
MAGTPLLKIQHAEVLACYPVLTYINRTGAIEGPNAGYILAKYLMPNQSFYSANIGHKETSVSRLSY